MIHSKIRVFASVLLSLTLLACSGGGGSGSSSSIGEDPGDNTPPMSTDWRDYNFMFNCGMTYSGANHSFAVQYKRFAQPITVNQSKIGAVITGIYYPSGQAVSIYDDAGGDPGTLLATANASNYFDKSDGGGSMCCNDRTFVWYMPSFLNTTSGSTYYIVTTPNNPGEYTSFKVTYLQGGSCYSAQTMKCQKMDDSWENCQIPGGQFSVMLQDVLY
ncbi:MAG: hypothetical protein A4S09_17320 [Proteobacteria bacterium SG_bin7]|nr:MAG: hypothetical protein A4S09_17320 [Proteobacteria bacterium SG_bin7]